MRTVPLPGIHFFDAWRIRSQLSPGPKLGEKLPSLGTTELIPEEPANEDYGHGDRADIQHRREQERDVRGSTKTIAQLALEMSHVHRLADLIKEKADMLKELAMRRQSYQDEVKESAKGKSTVASSAPKKQRTTGAPASVANPVPTPLPTAHGGKAVEVDGALLNPQALHSLGPSHKAQAPEAPLQPRRDMTPRPCQLRHLHQKSNKRIRPLRLIRREFRLEHLRFHELFVMKFLLSYPTFRKNGRLLKLT